MSDKPLPESSRPDIATSFQEVDSSDHLLSVVPLLIFIISPDGEILFFSPASSTLTGYPPAEILGKNWFTLFFPGPLATQVSTFLDLVLSGERTNIELDWSIKGGERQTISWSVTNRQGADGGISEILCVGRNLSSRKQLVEDLHQAFERYQNLLESVTNFIYTVKFSDGQIVETIHSPNCFAVTGYTPEDYKKDPDLWLKMVHEQDREVVLKRAQDILKGGIAQPIEHRIIKKDRVVRWVRNTPVVMRNSEGKILMYEGLISDITERKKAEEEIIALKKGLEVRVAFRTAQLERANQKLQEVTAFQEAILNSTNSIIISTDDEGTIRTFNEAAQKELGYLAEEMIGKVTPIMFLLPSEMERRAQYLMDQSFLTGSNEKDVLFSRARLGLPDESEWTFCRRNGKKFPVFLSIVALRKSLSGISGFLLMGIDNTQRRRLDEVKAMNEERLKTLLDLNLMTDASEKEVVTYTLKEVIRLTRSKIGFVGLLAENGRTFLMHSWAKSENPSGEVKTREVDLDIDDMCLMGEPIRQKKPVILNFCHEAPPPPLKHYSISNFLGVPVLDGEEVVLLAGVANKDDPFDENDAHQLELLFGDVWRLLQRRRLTSELAKARAHEMTIASQIQQTLLMGQVPQKIHGAKVAAMSIPSQEVDGDFFDFFTYDKYCFDLLIGDVMGKGIPAALVGAAMKSKFMRALSRLISLAARGRFPDPEEIVARVHSEMTPYLYRFDSFVSMHFARFDLKRREISLINCGHTHLIHYDADSGECVLVPGENMPLGLSETEIYRQKIIQMNSGDIFCFFSDGATEARNEKREFFGINRLVELIKTHHAAKPPELIKKIRQAITAFIGSDNLGDDLTFVAVSVNGEKD